ncbi:hypothetical protein UlMin_000934 [Ulmus minor]
MGSPSLIFTLLFFASTLFLFISQCDGSNYKDYGRVNNNVSKGVSQKVSLSVYYETLSQSCASFIVKNLAQVFDKDLNTIVNLKFVPWGNAYISKSTNAIICQNGPDECQQNAVQACIIDGLHDVNKQFALIFCIEFLVIEGRYKNWRSCFTQLGLPPKSVLDCYNSGNGTMIEVRKFANETAQLNPPHTLLPWVLVNNQPLRNDYRNFTSYICKAYKGNAVPKACQ